MEYIFAGKMFAENNFLQDFFYVMKNQQSKNLQNISYHMEVGDYLINQKLF